ncbi:predicted protein [Histoplasma capsulatum G186AR]|uniref:Uncharacterized protein n=1 Tax=Ajellomyces capsulatus (strain G186AR / H82 / ATCC MYA-2454 / RMSCC 2432) TaxID=447093 RepID=C0NB23_AJECG|nr:uncharacterized protein HCBG_00319 [Histoplasma capsulatum G186AR]EEH10864.1 predicted protein [Histoplasma capsulatum G186AR]
MDKGTRPLKKGDNCNRELQRYLYLEVAKKRSKMMEPHGRQYAEGSPDESWSINPYQNRNAFHMQAAIDGGKSAKSCQKSIAKVAGLEAIGFYQRGFVTHYHQAASRAIWHKALRAFYPDKAIVTVSNRPRRKRTAADISTTLLPLCNSRLSSGISTTIASNPILNAASFGSSGMENKLLRGTRDSLNREGPLGVFAMG